MLKECGKNICSQCKLYEDKPSFTSLGEIGKIISTNFFATFDVSVYEEGHALIVEYEILNQKC